MATCGDCTVFVPKLLLCPKVGRMVMAETEPGDCRMQVSTCSECAIFTPRFYNCTDAKMMGSPVGMQVRADSGACEAFAAR